MTRSAGGSSSGSAVGYWCVDVYVIIFSVKCMTNVEGWKRATTRNSNKSIPIKSYFFIAWSQSTRTKTAGVKNKPGTYLQCTMAVICRRVFCRN